MTARVTHMIDEAAHPEDVALLSLLLSGIPETRVEQEVVTIGARPAGLRVPEGVPQRHVGRRLSSPVLAGADPSLQTRLRYPCPDLVYAWGGATPAAEAAWRRECPLATVVSDPSIAPTYSRWWRSADSHGSRVEVICTNQHVQRRLVEHGLPADAATVVRPGIDFGAVRRVDRARLRKELDIPDDARPMITPPPPTRAGGHCEAMWAAAILHQIGRDLRMIVPGVSREQARLRRFAQSIYCTEMFRFPGDRYDLTELLAVSDVVVSGAVGDVATGFLAWAMAHSVPIVATAVPAVTELLADKHNAFLCKPGEPHTLALRIRESFDMTGTRQDCLSTARTQAFEVFRLQRCVDEHLKVIENLRAGRRAAVGVLDAAINA